MSAEELPVSDVLFECPQCRRWHDEPASAALGVRVLCLDCDLDVRLRDAFEASLVRPAEVRSRAA